MKRLKLLLLLCLFVIGGLATRVYAQPQQSRSDVETLPQEQIYGNIEPVAQFYDMMPTEVTVSQDGRIFVNFPRWGNPVEFTVAELINGQPGDR